VLVLVQLAPDRLARERDRVGGVVLRVVGDAEPLREPDQPADERDDVLRRQHADVVRHVHLEALVQLVAPDLRQVVALRVEEEPSQQIARVLERRRLAGALLLEDLDDRLLLPRRRVFLERVGDIDRVVEELEDLLVRARVELEAGRVVLSRERAQERGDRQLALPVDPRVDDALLVDLELEPGTAARHEVGDEDLLRRVFRLHQVGARRPDELRDDDALGPVDDEGAPLGHHREIAHEDRLLADLARLLVDEADRHRERHLVRQILLAALLDRDRGLTEVVVAEFHGECAGVVLDRRDIVDRLLETLLHEPLEGGLLDVDQVWKVKDVLQAGKALARSARGDLGGQEMRPPSLGRVKRQRQGKTQNGGATPKSSRENGLSASANLRKPPDRTETIATLARFFYRQAERRPKAPLAKIPTTLALGLRPPGRRGRPRESP
jgi:hypothetical protein